MEHHVYFWLEPERQNDPDRREFEAALAGLLRLPGVLDGIWATPAPVMERPVIDPSWDYALSMRFASIEAQDAYQTHPEHTAFVTEFKPWWHKVQVRDLLPGD